MNINEPSILMLIMYLLLGIVIVMLFIASFLRITDETFFMNKMSNYLFGWLVETNDTEQKKKVRL